MEKKNLVNTDPPTVVFIEMGEGVRANITLLISGPKGDSLWTLQSKNVRGGYLLLKACRETAKQRSTKSRKKKQKKPKKKPHN